MSVGATEIQPGNDNGGGSGGTGEQIDWKAKFEALGGEDAEKWKGLARKHETDFTKAQKEAQRLATAAAELEALKKAGQSDTEKFTSLKAQFDSINTEHQTVAQERDSLKVEIARLKAGLTAGLSLDDMAFIPSGTEEEMTAAAKTLAERLGAAQAPSFDGGPRRTADAEMSMGDFIRSERQRLRGR